MKRLIKFLILTVLVLSAASYGKSSAQKDFEAIVERIKSAVDSDLDVSSMEALKRFFEKMEYKINKTTLDGSKGILGIHLLSFENPALSIMSIFRGSTQEKLLKNKHIKSSYWKKEFLISS